MVTIDLMDFGFVDLKKAALILSVFKTENDRTELLDSDCVHISFNTFSGFVFISDSHCNSAMINDNNELEDFITCHDCGNAALKNDFDKSDKCCNEFFNNLFGE